MEYISLLESYTERYISASEFEKRFISLNRTDVNVYSEEVNRILSKLFIAIDSFCENPDLRDESDIDEIQLYDTAVLALVNLKTACK